jgi:hypothetical protein
LCVFVLFCAYDFGIELGSEIGIEITIRLQNDLEQELDRIGIGIQNDLK